MGIDNKRMLKHAELIGEHLDIPWEEIGVAYKNINRYPLRGLWRQYLRYRLLDIETAKLWQIDKPTIIVYRFANGERRFFLISNTRNICEDEANRMWYKFFPFISECGQSIYIDTGDSTTVEVDKDFAWLPQTYNYSHFLCDSIAPWIPFYNTEEVKRRKLQVLSLGRWGTWQEDVINKLGFESLPMDKGVQSSITLIKPRSVVIPTMCSKVMSQHILRNWFARNYTIQDGANRGEKNRLVYLTRSDERKIRVRNEDEIVMFVKRIGGLVIEPSKMTFSDKISALASAETIICEGSGSLNPILFGSDRCEIVLLTDPWTLNDPFFLEGGFPYLHLVVHRLEHIVGHSPCKLLGSPLASCHYRIEDISNKIGRQETSR